MIFGNCAKTGHHHQEYPTLKPKCAKYRNKHRTKYLKLTYSAKALNSQSNPFYVTEPLMSIDIPLYMLKEDASVNSNKTLVQLKIFMSPILNGISEPLVMSPARETQYCLGSYKKIV